jgi:hypothetical protein
MGGILTRGREGEDKSFNYLYVWFKRGKGRGGKKF